jgi:site-specific DNA recombinase
MLSGMTTKRAIIYCRISDDQLGLERGVDRQLKDCEKLAESEGYVVVEKFRENDISAYNKKKKRPKFEQTIEMVANGQADIIIVWHIERYLRRSSDLNRLIDLVEHGVCQVVSAISGRFDLTTADGKLQARIAVAVAEQASEHRAELRKRANIDRAERGEWSTANRPFGYTQDGQPKEPEAQAFRDAVIDVLAGKSIRSIVRTWNEVGLTTTRGNKWDGAQIRDILVKPRYAALRVHRGKVFGPGTWQPLIDLDTHHALVHFLNNPERSNGRVSWEQKHLGSGLYLCGICGAKMQSCAGGVGLPTGYRCRATKHLFCNAASLDTHVITVILGWFAEENCHLLIGNPIDLTELSTQRLAVQSKLENLATLFATDAIDGNQLATASKELRARLGALDSQLAAATGTSPAATLVHASQAASAASEDVGEAVADVWESMSVTQRAQAVDEVATVTVGPVIKRGPGFDPARVTIAARRNHT